MTETRILFLDFDDVLNTAQTLERGELFEQANVQTLNAILDRTDAKIVITSTWRLGATRKELEELLVNAGVHAAKRVVGSTRFLEERSRGAEIQDWLSRTRMKVADYVILDNRNDMDACLCQLVRTDPRCGLSPGQVERVVSLLGGVAV